MTMPKWQALDETGATPEGNSENEENLNPCDSPLGPRLLPMSPERSVTDVSGLDS
jgi:hypothetical protein